MGHDKQVPVEDELAARRLVARYAQLVDDRDMTVAAQLFAEAGRVVADGREHVGPAAVEEWLREVMAPLGESPARHHMANVVVSYGSHPDTLHAVSDLVLVAKLGADWRILLVGRYHDTFEGHGRQMRFRQRILTTA